MIQQPTMWRRSDRNAHGKEVYEGACVGCHGWSGVSPVIPFATLTGTRSVNDPTANNVAQVRSERTREGSVRGCLCGLPRLVGRESGYSIRDANRHAFSQ